MTTHAFLRGLAAAALAAACSAAFAAPAAPAQLTASTPLPAAPGAAGSATLAGVDTNGNAVRDDLEPFLQQYFGSKPRLLRAMSNMLIGLQATITATTPQQSARAQLMTIRATECLMAVKADLPKDDARDSKMVALLVNTPERTAAIAAHQARIREQTFTMRELEEWEVACDVRADLADRSFPIPPRPQ
jgi:hypothetical protein